MRCYENGTLSLANGKMSYVRFGRGDRTVVILPGLTDGLVTVRGKARFLSVPYRKWLKTCTFYQFSRKEPLPEPCSVREMAADQAEAMDRLGLQKACVMGISQGGMIAQYLAIDRPDLVEKLVLAVTAPSVNDVIRDAIGGRVAWAKRGDHRRLMITTVETAYRKRLRLLRLAYPIFGLVARPKNYCRFLTNARAILDFNAREEVGKISCPTLILGGEEDRTVGAQGSRDLHAMISGSQLYLYPHLGHAAFRETPDFNARTLRFFLEDLSTSS